MKILLTGSRGNLGARIIHYCPYSITGLHRDNWLDLDHIMKEGIDVVIHAASDLKNSVSEVPSNIMDSNIMTTTRMLETMKRNSVPRLIFLSSCAVYGESMITIEETPCSPISINGIVKLLNEKIIEIFCSNNNIQYEIYRVFNMYGGDDHFSILNHMKNAVIHNHEFQLNNKGISQRDFIHVDDVAKIVIKLINIKHPHTHLNIGTGVSTRVSDIFNIAKTKYPELKARIKFVNEAEYSRAEISKLRSFISYSFLDIMEYMELYF